MPTTFCTDCGARYKANEAFCTECGSVREPAPSEAVPTSGNWPPSTTQSYAASKRGGRRIAVWTAVVFVLALAGVLFAGQLLTSNGDELAASGEADLTAPSASPTGDMPEPASSASSVTPSPSAQETGPVLPEPSATAQPSTSGPDAAPSQTSDLSPTPIPSPDPVPDPEQPQTVLEALALSDKQAAEVLVRDEPGALSKVRSERWYPMLGSKCAGMGAYDELEQPLDLGPGGFIGMPDGVGESYTYLGSQRILALLRYYQWRFGPNVINATTQQLGRTKTSYEGICGDTPMWLTLNTEVSFNSASKALAWCKDNGFIPGECGAFPAFMPNESLRWT